MQTWDTKKNTTDVSHNIQLSGPYKCPVGWTCPVGNSTIKNLPGERPSDSLW